MKWFVLLLILAVCVCAYLRAQQTALWNSAMTKLNVPQLLVTPAAKSGVGPDALTSVMNSIADLAAPAPGPLPPLITDSDKLTTGMIHIDSLAQQTFLEHLNADAAEVDALARAVEGKGPVASKKDWEAVEAKIDAYEDEVLGNPLTINDATTRGNIIQQHKDELSVCENWPCDFGRHREIARRLQANRLPQVVALGRQAAQPVDLAFTAEDGSQVNLAALRGKVVLVDFWASWCPFCVQEIPTTVAIYNKYHASGFEILGISWDQYQSMMDRFMAGHGMTWPQYFGGDHTGNAITRKLNVGTLPLQWLVDKHGCLVNATRGADLDEEITQLMAEQ